MMMMVVVPVLVMVVMVDHGYLAESRTAVVCAVVRKHTDVPKGTLRDQLRPLMVPQRHL